MSPKNSINIHDLWGTIRAFLIWAGPFILAMETPLGQMLPPEYAPIVSALFDMYRRYKR